MKTINDLFSEIKKNEIECSISYSNNKMIVGLRKTLNLRTVIQEKEIILEHDIGDGAWHLEMLFKRFLQTESQCRIQKY